MRPKVALVSQLEALGGARGEAEGGGEHRGREEGGREGGRKSAGEPGKKRERSK